MSRDIISSFETFCEKFPEIKKFDDNNPRISALKRYFGKGGVVSAIKDKDWPKLIYPTKDKLLREITEIDKQLGELKKKKKVWDKKLMSAKTYNLRNSTLKFIDPVYWKHFTKMISDEDYKKDVELVKLPVNMVSEPKFRPMIEMFVNDIEYRKKLAETVQNSIVYKKDKRVGKYAEELQLFRIQTSQKNVDSLKKKIDALEAQADYLRIIKKWIQ